MHLEGLLHFAKDFEVVPQLLSKLQLIKCFNQSKFGAGQSAVNSVRLGYDEWLECLGRCALNAFHIHSPPKAQQCIVFQGDCACSGFHTEESCSSVSIVKQFFFQSLLLIAVFYKMPMMPMQNTCG